MGGEDRGGLPDLDPDLSKSRGGNPESRDEKVGGESGYIPIYPDVFGQKKSGKVEIYPDFGLKNREESRISRLSPT